MYLLTSIPNQFLSHLLTHTHAQRCDELANELWDITTKRNTEAQELLERIEEDGWAENEGLSFATSFAVMMQMEIDRYFHTIKIAQDYFSVLKAQIVYEEEDAQPHTLPLFTASGKDGKVKDKRKEKKKEKKKDKKGKKDGDTAAPFSETSEGTETLTESLATALGWLVSPQEIVDQMNSLVEFSKGDKKTLKVGLHVYVYVSECVFVCVCESEYAEYPSVLNSFQANHECVFRMCVSPG